MKRDWIGVLVFAWIIGLSSVLLSGACYGVVVFPWWLLKFVAGLLGVLYLLIDVLAIFALRSMRHDKS